MRIPGQPPAEQLLPFGKPPGFAGNGKLDYCAADSTKKRRATKKKARHLVSKVPGAILATTYSRTTYRCTTIGSAAFHFRVRNGNGWIHCAGSPDSENLKFEISNFRSARVWRHSVVNSIKDHPVFTLSGIRTPQKPGSLTFAYQGKIQLSKNKTEKWRKKAKRALVSLS